MEGDLLIVAAIKISTFGDALQLHQKPSATPHPSGQSRLVHRWLMVSAPTFVPMAARRLSRHRMNEQYLVKAHDRFGQGPVPTTAVEVFMMHNLGWDIGWGLHPG
jgi:hypothetical protein